MRAGIRDHPFLSELLADQPYRFLMKCANETVTIELKNGTCRPPTLRDPDLATYQNSFGLSAHRQLEA